MCGACFATCKARPRSCKSSRRPQKSTRRPSPRRRPPCDSARPFQSFFLVPLSPFCPFFPFCPLLRFLLSFLSIPYFLLLSISSKSHTFSSSFSHDIHFLLSLMRSFLSLFCRVFANEGRRSRIKPARAVT